jgi:hypothetical protein
MILFNSPYLQISIDEEKSIITNTWLPKTEDMTDAEYQENMLEFAKFVEAYKPKYHLIESKNFLYGITVEMQEWTNNTVFPRLAEAGIKKIAFTVSSEMVAQMSIEQALEEEKAAVFQVKYFDSGEQAVNWFFE